MRKNKFLRNLAKSYLDLCLRNENAPNTKTLVFPEARTIYVPVPKAANSSARRALFPLMGYPSDAPLFVHSSEEIKAYEHPCSEALSFAGSDWFIFAIVRHPYARAYSAWNEKLARRDTPFGPLKSMGLESGDSFETFLKACNIWPHKQLNDHFMPQVDLLAPAMDRVELFHLENLAEGWPAICDRIEAQGAPRPSPMRYMNSFKHGKSHDFSATETRLMQRLYGRDLTTLGYR